MKKYHFHELKIGLYAESQKIITEKDILDFSHVSEDTNPVHLDEDYAKSTLFKGRVAHGMLTASLISGVLGTKLPGLGSIYVKQSLVFKRPVRIGDCVTTSVEIVAIDAEKQLVDLKTQCKVLDKIVIDGEAEVLFPLTSDS